FLWVRTCWWVDHDTHELGLATDTWNPLLFGCGVLGLIVVWLLPWFWISFVLLVMLYLMPTLAYVNLRNRAVPVPERVLTGRHIASLMERYLKIKLGGGQVDEDLEGPPIVFVGKSAKGRGDEDDRVARAASSKGYKGAREMVYEAIKSRSTDIHMEPTKDEMTVRYRIDGILQPADPFSRSMGDAVINIFKVLADLDITDRRKPQDGSFSAELQDRMIDFRVATAGSVAGEKLVMRILDKERQIIDLTRLGIRDKMRDQVNSIAQQPHGMLIVCGPTG